jgi:heptosyltransferase-2
VYSKILIRATNWVGDAVMCLPALRSIRERFPNAHLAILARPWVSDLYEREPFCDEMIPYRASGQKWNFAAKWALARELRARRFDCAILLQNAFDAALIAWLARIPVRIGYKRDGRGPLLTQAISVPTRDEIPRHESYYYLELLRRAGWMSALPNAELIRLEGAAAARESGCRQLTGSGLREPVIGLSPGAAYGTAKRWLPERFADAAARLANDIGGTIALFGSPDERELCGSIAERLLAGGHTAHNFAGETTLRQYIELAAACRVYLTNDSGAMHIASALGIPTVAIFGATDHIGTGPTGPLARVVREPVECSPCLLRECPIDHRCMTRVSSERVADVALDLLK